MELLVTALVLLNITVSSFTRTYGVFSKIATCPNKNTVVIANIAACIKNVGDKKPVKPARGTIFRTAHVIEIRRVHLLKPLFVYCCLSWPFRGYMFVPAFKIEHSKMKMINYRM